MQIQINPGSGVHISEALERNIHEALGAIDRRFGDQLTRIEVHFQDVNGPKGGVNKHCRIEARPRGLDPVIAENTAEDAYDSARGAARKLESVLDTRFGKLASKQRGNNH
ncbi:HPF/RaiA family ribosome-associated protein [Halorhodospira halochloris]|uniref:Ribosomal subunit interface protein n=1 Tax=Halorhodospira halochloris TaxID=1052 RepID=A0A120MZ64_HALHR|nr:HPF/RaiA family ribosome-associated protein [Halorhodospira halochloris]MBK1651018.1 ribose ABC transporter permease [Halorhodospira halochloris]MCG5529385.1 HPF/RaiA family ribosome-associated protein [Halorhodospira halochloris]BAU56471.1 ribosomal subunit interface protein [Halorhodospira halochloris]